MKSLVAIALSLIAAPVAADTLAVGSKNFEESRLLAEIFAQLIEARTEHRVERRFNLAGTQVCFEALRSGAIDLYPEYTGTGLASILKLDPAVDAAEALATVRREFRSRFDLHWLGPLGFENAYAIALPEERAERLGLRTISDLVPEAGRMTAGFGYEFVERPDGLPGLRDRYGLQFAEVRTLQQTLKYQAVAEGRIDVLDVYTTDGRLLVHGLRVLEDDLRFFPPYEAAPLVRGATLREHPRLTEVLGLLEGAFDEPTMRRLNLRLQRDKEEVDVVAAAALAELGLLHAEGPDDPPPPAAEEGFFAYVARQRGELGRRLVEHLLLSAAALVLGALIAIPAGLWLERRRRLAEPLIRLVATTQTIPSIALLAFMVPLLGVGWLPALVALTIYSWFPMLRNTYSGVRDADPAAVAAAEALGMTSRQRLLSVRLPLAAPILLAGVRTSAVWVVGTATLAAFIGAGGLGVPIVAGLQLADPRRILAGALPAALLAIVVDALLGLVERATRPRGLGLSRRGAT